MEKWEAERQSCSLMACKVISCGLVKLKAASLGCNSWQSCPPFTLANPSFRAFSHNHRFMERGRKERAVWIKEENDDAKKTKQTQTPIRHRMKRHLNGNQNTIRAEALVKARELDLSELQNGSLVSFCPSCKALLYNYSCNKHGSRVACIHSNVITSRSAYWKWRAAFPVWSSPSPEMFAATGHTS